MPVILGMLSQERIRPAVYRKQKQSFRTRPPWKLILGLLLAVAVGVGLYTYRQWRRVEAYRTNLNEAFDVSVAPVLRDARAFEDELTRHLLIASKGAAERHVATGLEFDRLRAEGIVYARVRLTGLDDRQKALEQVKEQNVDALGACLGISIRPAKDAFASVETFDEAWAEDVEKSSELMRLRLRMNQLERAVDGELLPIRTTLDARYLMAFVVQGQSRLRDPIDVFLWDRADGTLLLRTRVEADGKLIPVRNRIGGSAGKVSIENEDPIAAADCSIATQIKNAMIN